MKIKKEDFNELKIAIELFGPENWIESYKESNQSAERFRWDIFHAVKHRDRFVMDLYDYLNDATIYTALKKIIKF